MVEAEGWFVPDKVAVIDVSGEITSDEDAGLFSGHPNSVVEVKERLRKAEDDASVRAVVLRIDSPGGGVTASDVIHREIVRFRERTGRPVIACLMDTAASGGYYVACAADAIVAHPTTVTGSIGVIMQHIEVEALLAKVGVKAEAIASGDKKDLGSPFRGMKDDERKILQSMIDHLHARFVKVVADGRRLDAAKVRALADGRVYTAEQAKGEGLVDAIGYLDDAIALAKGKAGVADASVVLYKRRGEPSATIFSRAAAAGGAEVNLFKLDARGLLDAARPRFLYLWRPGAR
jgi:protease-4